jgi:hypothetical protein
VYLNKVTSSCPCPRQEGVYREMINICTLSWPQHWVVGSGQIDASANSPPPPRKKPPNPVNRSLGGPNSWSGHSGEEKNLVPLLFIEAQIIQTVTQWPHQLHYRGCHIHNVRMFVCFWVRFYLSSAWTLFSLLLAVCTTAKIIFFLKKAEFGSTLHSKSTHSRTRTDLNVCPF